MKSLVASLEDNGFRSVRTYIQSGNVVFQSTKGTAHSIGTRIARLIKTQFAFDVPVMTLSDVELWEAPVSPDLESLTQVKVPTEAFALKGRVFYMHTPGGAGNSKLAARVERALGVHTTCRNWRTVNQLREMCDAISISSTRRRTTKRVAG